MKELECMLCGGNATIKTEDNKRHVECENCGSYTEAAWNEIKKLKNTTEKFEWNGYMNVYVVVDTKLPIKPEVWYKMGEEEDKMFWEWMKTYYVYDKEAEGDSVSLSRFIKGYTSYSIWYANYALAGESIKFKHKVADESLRDVCRMMDPDVHLYDIIYPVDPLLYKKETVTHEDGLTALMLKSEIAKGSVSNDVLAYGNENESRKHYMGILIRRIRDCIRDNDLLDKAMIAILGDSYFRDEETSWKRELIGDSIYQWAYAYIGYIIGMEKYKCAYNLWQSSLVYTYDGRTARLHSGYKMDVVKEIT